MRAGRRRNRIIIERYGKTQDVYGAETLTWATLKTVWAHINPTGGKERTQGGALDADVTHIINIRHTDITPADRLNDKGRIYNIVRVLDLNEQRKEMELQVIENV